MYQVNTTIFTLRCTVGGYMEDCVCNVGYLRDGSACVRKAECGAVINGLYFSKGMLCLQLFVILVNYYSIEGFIKRLMLSLLYSTRGNNIDPVFFLKKLCTSKKLYPILFRSVVTKSHKTKKSQKLNKHFYI